MFGITGVTVNAVVRVFPYSSSSSSKSGKDKKDMVKKDKNRRIVLVPYTHLPAHETQANLACLLPHVKKNDNIPSFALVSILP